MRETLTPLVHGDDCSSFLKRHLGFGSYLGATGVANRERPNCCLHCSTSLKVSLRYRLGTECKTVFLQLPCGLKNTVMRVEDSCQCSLREEKPTGLCPLPLSSFYVSVPLFVPDAAIYSFLLLCVSLSSCPCHTN